MSYILHLEINLEGKDANTFEEAVAIIKKRTASGKYAIVFDKGLGYFLTKKKKKAKTE